MVPPLLLLSSAGAIAGEELVLFVGQCFGISPRNCGNEKLFDNQHFFLDLLSCLVVSVGVLSIFDVYDHNVLEY